MQYIQFDRSLSHLESFDTIGYDVKTETLIVKHFDGSEQTFYHISEKKVFHWLITEDKEKYYHKIVRDYEKREKVVEQK